MLAFTRTNEEVVSIPVDSPLGRRGVSNVLVKPLNWKKEQRAKDYVQARAKANRQEVLGDMDTGDLKEMVEKAQETAAEQREKERQDAIDSGQATAESLKRDEEIEWYDDAWPYVVYAGVRNINGNTVPAPPSGMLDNCESEFDGWLEDECSTAETKQLAIIVLDASGMIPESKEAEGNASGASTPPSSSGSA